MFRKSGSFAIAGVLLIGTASQGITGGKAVECYEKYDVPAVYGTVRENIVINPGSRRVVYNQPIYGTRKRAVLVAPQSVTYEIVPAVTRMEHRRVRVEGGYSWEWRVINGRKVLCKIKHKAHYETVAETVIVRPERRREVVIPAVYDYEVERVEVRAERRRIIDTPTTYQTVEREVLVSEGSTSWKRVRIPQHCQ